jgi:hypothetical protein
MTYYKVGINSYEHLLVMVHTFLSCLVPSICEPYVVMVCTFVSTYWHQLKKVVSNSMHSYMLYCPSICHSRVLSVLWILDNNSNILENNIILCISNFYRVFKTLLNVLWFITYNPVHKIAMAYLNLNYPLYDWPLTYYSTIAQRHVKVMSEYQLTFIYI